MKPKSHLTLTGYEAGRTICGGVKDPSMDHYHAVWAPRAVFSSADTCADCLALWNECSKELDQEARFDAVREDAKGYFE